MTEPAVAPVEPVVVLVGRDTDAAVLGAVARELADAGRRAAVFVGDVTDVEGLAALDEMLAEL
ncbi:MAG TPA: hypothetical protein VGA62_06410, partial [Acidimicrobiia bacterium]